MTRRKLLGLFALTGGPACKLRQPTEFALPDANGATVRLSDYEGKIVLLNFWATWCGYCVEEMPWLMEYAEEFRAQGFEVIGVALDQGGWDAVQPFLQENRINYPVVVGHRDLAFAYNALAVPTTWLIDRDGSTAGYYRGLIDREEMRAEIQALL